MWLQSRKQSCRSPTCWHLSCLGTFCGHLHVRFAGFAILASGVRGRRIDEFVSDTGSKDKLKCRAPRSASTVLLEMAIATEHDKERRGQHEEGEELGDIARIKYGTEWGLLMDKLRIRIQSLFVGMVFDNWFVIIRLLPVARCLEEPYRVISTSPGPVRLAHHPHS